MGDLIDRQAAIEYFMTNTNWHDEDGYEIHDAEDKRALLKSYFDGIPPAQPDNKINLCDSCKHTYPVCPARSTDVIFGNGTGNDNICACSKYEPSAQPEQKVGKWIIKDNPGTGWYRVTCSECGEEVTSEIRLIGFIPNCKALWDYCPYCGAKMKEQDE